MTEPEILALVDEGLGNSSYVVDLGDRRAMVVDSARDPEPYLAEAERTLIAAVGDVAHPAWRATAVGVYRLWRDTGYVAGPCSGASSPICSTCEPG